MFRSSSSSSTTTTSSWSSVMLEAYLKRLHSLTHSLTYSIFHSLTGSQAFPILLHTLTRLPSNLVERYKNLACFHIYVRHHNVLSCFFCAYILRNVPSSALSFRFCLRLFRCCCDCSDMMKFSTLISVFVISWVMIGSWWWYFGARRKRNDIRSRFKAFSFPGDVFHFHPVVRLGSYVDSTGHGSGGNDYIGFPFSFVVSDVRLVGSKDVWNEMAVRNRSWDTAETNRDWRRT